MARARICKPRFYKEAAMWLSLFILPPPFLSSQKRPFALFVREGFFQAQPAKNGNQISFSLKHILVEYRETGHELSVTQKKKLRKSSKLLKRNYIKVNASKAWSAFVSDSENRALRYTTTVEVF